MNQRRRYERTPASHPVIVKIIDATSAEERVIEEVDGVLLDASFRGCKLGVKALSKETRAELALGSWIVGVTTREPPLLVRGVVKWSNDQGQGVLLGVEYSTEVPEQVLLVEHLHRVQPKKRPIGALVAGGGALLLAVLAAFFATNRAPEQTVGPSRFGSDTTRVEHGVSHQTDQARGASPDSPNAESPSTGGIPPEIHVYSAQVTGQNVELTLALATEQSHSVEVGYVDAKGNAVGGCEKQRFDLVGEQQQTFVCSSTREFQETDRLIIRVLR